jgi:hypothetical protein
MIVGVAANGPGAGKDTVGQYLVDNFKFERVAWADLLKISVAHLFGLGTTDEERIKTIDLLKNHPDVKITLTVGKKAIRELTMRHFLQRYGTEAHRVPLWEDIWVDAAFRKHYLDTHEENGKRYVVTDVRFDNEVKAIHDVGGKVIYLIRPDVPEFDHKSEELDPALCDFQIANDQSLDILYYEVDKVMEQLLGVTSGAST